MTNKKLTPHEIWTREYERARSVAPICLRCQRPMVGWLLKRRDICSPPDWWSCTRNPKSEIL